MRLFGRDADGLTFLLSLFVVLLLVSSGLCGLQLVTVAHVPSWLASIFVVAGLLEVAAMILSVLGIAILSIVWLIRSLSGASAEPPSNEVQRLFDKDDAVDEDDPL